MSSEKPFSPCLQPPNIMVTCFKLNVCTNARRQPPNRKEHPIQLRTRYPYRVQMMRGEAPTIYLTCVAMSDDAYGIHWSSHSKTCYYAQHA